MRTLSNTGRLLHVLDLTCRSKAIVFNVSLGLIFKRSPVFDSLSQVMSTKQGSGV